MSGHYNLPDLQAEVANKVDSESLSNVAFSGDYSDLNNVPEMPFVNAEDYGFDVNNTGAENSAALESAFNAAPDGATILVYAPSDFLCDRVVIADKSIEYKFVGGGRFDVGSVGGAFEYNNTQYQIETISSIDLVDRQVEGSDNTITRIACSNSSSFNRDDLVKVVSDDQDLWDDRTGAKRGEFAIVLDSDSNYIYLNGVLEDEYTISENARVVKIPKNKFKVDVKIKSTRSNDSTLFNVRSAYQPEFVVDITEHGGICLNTLGCYQAEHWVSGSGKGTSAGNLSYLVNDSCSQNTVIHYIKGNNFRSVVTTNAGFPSDNSTSIHSYGATRNLTVLRGISIGALGSPWDEHEGARRSSFINCDDISPMRSAAAFHCSFQARGRDTSIINPRVYGVQPADTAYPGYAVFKTTQSTSGTVTIENPRCIDLPDDAKLFESSQNPTFETPNVVVNGGNIRFQNSQTCMFFEDLNVTFNGTFIENMNVTRDFTQMFDIRANSRIVLNNPYIRVYANNGSTPSSARLFRLYDGSTVVGSLNLETDGIAFSNGIRSEESTPIVSLKILAIKGTDALTQTGTFGFIDYSATSLEDLSLNTGTVRPPQFNANPNGFRVLGLPTSSSGLSSGEFWNDGGVVKVAT